MDGFQMVHAIFVSKKAVYSDGALIREDRYSW